MRKVRGCMRIAVYVTALSLVIVLSGCDGKGRSQEAAENAPAITIEDPAGTINVEEPAPSTEAEPTSATEAEAAPSTEAEEPATSAEPEEPATSTEPEEPTGEGRQDGERFEETIMLEGMEETVKYEHAINKELGVEMDYEYDSLARQSDPESERFVSFYDDPSSPDNYLELTRVPEGKDAAAETVKKDLSEKYEIEMDETTLEGAGDCVRLDVVSLKGGALPDRLQTVHIIPAGDGCIIARAHYTLEAAEGFGSRFAYMVNTLSVIDAR